MWHCSLGAVASEKVTPGEEQPDGLKLWLLAYANAVCRDTTADAASHGCPS